MEAKKPEKTFEHQKFLPKLPVPDLDATLDKYLKSAFVELSADEQKETKRVVEEFRKSPIAQQLQQALQQRAKQEDSWLDEWWYDAYGEIREPLVPYLSLASLQARAPRAPGSQISRAADGVYHLMVIWQRHRRQTYPVMRSRGVVWDMQQNYVLFNASRVPQKPKDQMMRYFKTEDEGDCPSNLIVLCRGNIWSFEALRDRELKSPDEFYKIFEHIKKHSFTRKHSVATLTTEHRDKWTDMREHLQKLSAKNPELLKRIESACFVVSLTDDEILDENELLIYSMIGRPENQWADKNMNIGVMLDGQITTQADHSNADAIVILDAGNTSGKFIRHHIWTPQNHHFEKPELLEFDLDETLKAAIEEAEKNFYKNKALVGCRVLRYNGYGNEKLKKMKFYMDTIVQLAMQIAYAKVHGSWCPIYETASTRKFYLARTETVRSRTKEAVLFGKAVINNAPLEEQRRLFKDAYIAHNELMAEAIEGLGCDRHLYGLRKTLEVMNRGGCNPKRALPQIFKDKAWKHSGGDGNFKLSTSFIGYDKFGTYGYVCAMCPDGYGSFYKIHDDGMLLTATNYKGFQTDLDEYTKNIAWAMDRIGDVIGINQAKL
ncbi:unnamed protein product, partial [Mesorhabditis belari]|uniref:Choline/carnitine acyltransferase domain-containing protein n=1 Tax=Mesorhabditis belari TaxID=2138241 RepID=A0AAF3J1J5_9BILA